jgi:hypothetical protein
MRAQRNERQQKQQRTSSRSTERKKAVWGAQFAATAQSQRLALQFSVQTAGGLVAVGRGSDGTCVDLHNLNAMGREVAPSLRVNRAAPNGRDVL